MTQATEQLSKAATAGAVAFGGIYGEVIEQAAQVGFAAVRELGISSGNVDLPTWQIALTEIKRDCRTAARLALELKGSEPENVHLVWRGRRLKECPPEQPSSYAPSWRQPWPDLTAAQRFQFGLFVGVVRAFEGITKKIS